MGGCEWRCILGGWRWMYILNGWVGAVKGECRYILGGWA